MNGAARDEWRCFFTLSVAVLLVAINGIVRKWYTE
jgi:hypothetical protein